MTDREEWGAWIEHDGKGCPVPNGVWCHRVFDRPANGDDVTMHGALEDVSPVMNEWEFKSWIWTEGVTRITKYRIRRPRALLDLIDMVESLPAPEPVWGEHV